jgi:polyisoprenoid-binding protein YceI
LITSKFATVALLVLAATAAGAQGTARVAVSGDSRLWVDGTSNLHSWSCKTDKLDANIDVDASAAIALSAAAPKALKKVQIRVPSRSLKCNHNGMEGNVYKALKADDDASQISWVMSSFESAAGDAKDAFTLHTLGALTIAGVEKKISVDVVATRLPDGTIRAVGMVPIKMSDYGITPPTAIFGRLKTGDDVKVNFELTVGAKAIAAAVTKP